MEDLIKEEEFIKKEYNPWPSFKIFYFIIPGFAVINLVAEIFRTDYTFIITSLNTLLPLILAFVMIFYRKRNILLPVATIVKALFYLMCMVCITYQVSNIFEALNYGLDPMFYANRVPYGFVFPLIYFLFCVVVTLPVRALVKRNDRKTV